MQRDTLPSRRTGSVVAAYRCECDGVLHLSVLGLHQAQPRRKCYSVSFSLVTRLSR